MCSHESWLHGAGCILQTTSSGQSPLCVVTKYFMRQYKIAANGRAMYFAFHGENQRNIAASHPESHLVPMMCFPEACSAPPAESGSFASM